MLLGVGEGDPLIRFAPVAWVDCFRGEVVPRAAAAIPPTRFIQQHDRDGIEALGRAFSEVNLDTGAVAVFAWVVLNQGPSRVAQ